MLRVQPLLLNFFWGRGLVLTPKVRGPHLVISGHNQEFVVGLLLLSFCELLRGTCICSSNKLPTAVHTGLFQADCCCCSASWSKVQHVLRSNPIKEGFFFLSFSIFAIFFPFERDLKDTGFFSVKTFALKL